MRCSFVLGLAAAAVFPSIALAWSDCETIAQHPDRYPNVIFCDGFDTYCQGGGYPGNPECATGSSKDDVTLGRVWKRTSSNEYNGNLQGQELTIQEADSTGKYLIGAPGGISFIWPDYPNPGDNLEYPGEADGPYGVRLPMDSNVLLGQMTFRDWGLSGLPMDSTPQVLNMSRFIGYTFNTAGHQYTSVSGTDADPLIVEYFLGGGQLASVYFANAYVEVALDNERANTDYVRSMNGLDCEAPINQGPWPIMCAQYDPDGGKPAGCPPVDSAPIRGAIAVGLLSTVDTDPAHCGELAHGSENYRLMLFDGKAWRKLKKDTIPGATFGGTVLPYKWSSVMPPPAGEGVGIPGDFVLDGGEYYSQPRSWHWIKLIIKSETIDVEMTALEKAETSGDQYYVKSTVTGVPRAYKFTGVGPIGSGAFNTVRIGMGSGCALDNNTTWDYCAVNGAGHRSRTAIQINPNSAVIRQGSVYFNDFVIYGGTGFELAGACCGANGATCSEVVASDCTGLFHGPSTRCESVSCCPKSYGDSDGDGDVDVADFAVLQACLTMTTGELSDACKCLDLDVNRTSDNVLNNLDIEHFIGCANGPAIGSRTDGNCLGVGW